MPGQEIGAKKFTHVLITFFRPKPLGYTRSPIFFLLSPPMQRLVPGWYFGDVFEENTRTTAHDPNNIRESE